MRIALISETISSHNRVGVLLSNLLEYLDTHGHSSVVFTAEDARLQLGRTPVVPVEKTHTGAGFEELRAGLADYQPDVVHAMQPIALGAEALRAARELGIPSLVSYHSEFNRLARDWGFGIAGELMWSYFRLFHDLSDMSVVPTHFQMMHLRNQGFERVRTWATGVDCDLFSPKRRSISWRRHISNGEADKMVLVYAGKLSAEKRVELLKPIIEANPNCHLAIVGAGAEATWLRDHFEGTNTTFTGYLDQGDLAEVYAAADAFVHPAGTEISPTTSLEAMASGLPVLAPHSGSIIDFTVHGENALMFLPGDTDQQSAYVRELANKPRLRSDLSRIARQTALAHSWQISLTKLTNLYSQLISAHQQPVAWPQFQSLPLTQVHS
jgi:glycosyltransferase involved in cell wall biosynthesis